MPRHFRSISDYLSLGTLQPEPAATPGKTPGERLGATVNKLARDALFANYPTAEVRQPRRPFERRDIVTAERITVKHIRDAVAQLAEDRVPPIPNVGRTVLRGLVDANTKERLRVDEDPAAEGFGPFYEVTCAPDDMTAISGEAEFQAGLASGEFRVAGKGRILVRPPMVAVDDIIDPATGKVLRCEVNAIRLDKET